MLQGKRKKAPLHLHAGPSANRSMDTKPKVLIMIAAEQISGPGKGVLQLVEHAAASGFEYLVCNFDPKGRPAGEFVHEARRRKLNLRLLKQRSALDLNLIVQARRLVREHDVEPHTDTWLQVEHDRLGPTHALSPTVDRVCARLHRRQQEEQALQPDRALGTSPGGPRGRSLRVDESAAGSTRRCGRQMSE